MSSARLEREAEQWIKKHEREILDKYQKCLIGKKIVDFKDIEVDSYVQGKIVLDDGNTFVIHHRLADENEKVLKKEVSSRYIKVETFYQKYVLGNTIDEIEISIKFLKPYIKVHLKEDFAIFYIEIEEYYDTV